MSDIDPEKLEHAIIAAESTAWGPGMAAVVAAARAHLATLPRWKEVEVESWVVISALGVRLDIFEDEASARRMAAQYEGRQVIRLTGTAKVKVTP